MQKKARLTSGNVSKQLLNLYIPMIAGMLGMITFNLIDTFFIGQLGSEQLAAMSFTFPVVLVIHSIAAGVALGSSAIISKLVGEEDHCQISRLSTASLILGFIVNILLAAIGLITIKPLFSLMGAKGITLVYIKEYMTIWYLGMIMLVIPQIGNNIIRALGDTKVPSLIMAVAAITNAILDPLLIFGIGPFPDLGIQGAAIATVISRTLTFIVALYVLKYREQLITFDKISFSKLIESWKKILYIGVPNALVQMSLPIGAGIITRLLSTYGTEAVASFGVATKIESFALSFTGALAIAIGPFIGQNLGAKKFNRAAKSYKTVEMFSIIIGIVLALVLGIFSKPIAAIFNDDSNVINTITLYIRIVPIAYAFQGILRIGSTVLNVLNKPFHSSTLIVIQIFILYVPLATLGSKLFGLTGIFGALSLSYLISGTIAHFETKRQLKIYMNNLQEKDGLYTMNSFL
ncbi:putative efflux protein, MATE family [Dethiosulfatibacter aminovorans DSM 17477]|uniref:Probable multidrug resistance protein NorM n=1 Tax=Dethiosulfatibacter aminovorans DSM 17477 TaxID=1121476 RepID=A0A1M6IHR8_9FIRM|nr:MATE family efflux transporter [Dethiosulfatibacter aminovorans]SHJ33985.1 putative efflux protein, MATE family [Dethiosulfatibacter aminovorans DSM 17477]